MMLSLLKLLDLVVATAIVIALLMVIAVWLLKIVSSKLVLYGIMLQLNSKMSSVGMDYLIAMETVMVLGHSVLSEMEFAMTVVVESISIVTLTTSLADVNSRLTEEIAIAHLDNTLLVQEFVQFQDKLQIQVFVLVTITTNLPLELIVQETVFHSFQPFSAMVSLSTMLTVLKFSSLLTVQQHLRKLFLVFAKFFQMVVPLIFQDSLVITFVTRLRLTIMQFVFTMVVIVAHNLVLQKLKTQPKLHCAELSHTIALTHFTTPRWKA
jgi:hypothetical protein